MSKVINKFMAFTDITDSPLFYIIMFPILSLGAVLLLNELPPHHFNFIVEALGNTLVRIIQWITVICGLWFGAVIVIATTRLPG